jgi:hypothetical protein
VSDSKKPLFTVPTPFPGAQEVTLFQGTWENHIVIRHVYMTDRVTTVQKIVSNPSVVLSGGNPDPDYVIYLNQSLTTFSGTCGNLSKGWRARAWFRRISNRLTNNIATMKRNAV